ncbi:MAG: 3-deoxy-D-manno-octulosonic acid transferase [Formosimonas sp.]
MNWRLALYTAVLYLIAPLAPLYLLWRARKQPEYARGWGERYALAYAAPRSSATRRVWLHAVSLGETRAAKPLVDALFAAQPTAHVILTHTTPTGRAAGQELFAAYLAAGRMTQVYVPYDLPDVLARFLRHFAPTDVWLMETEIWPNMIAACVKRNIPVALVNGRLSAKTLQKTLKNNFVAQLFGRAYAQLTHVCAQSDADAQRYAQIGAQRVHVLGNLKFDMNIPSEQVQRGLALKKNATKPIALLASTRDGEEQMWLDALKNHRDDAQWWLVPRHPQRFDEVAQLLQQAGFADVPRISQSPDWRDAPVVLGDTMGEMFMYYALADVVLMGGGWQPLGGQNCLEPQALGKPTIVGPHMYNFAQITADALAASALRQVDDFATALQLTDELLHNATECADLQQRAHQFVAEHQGATARTLAVLC